jgi:serralysin
MKETPMNQILATETAFANFGPFDPSDVTSGDVLFLDNGADMFAAIGAMIAAPVAAAPQPAASGLRPIRTEADIHHAIGPALTAGAMLQTDKGEVAAQDLRAGQRILTRDKGFQTVLWVGQRRVTVAEMTAQPDLRPVRISAGALGPNLPATDLLVPGCQRMMVEGPRTKLMFGAREVFVQAQHLVGYPGITLGDLADITYVHALCRAHEVIWADGVWTESYQPTTGAVESLNAVQRVDITNVLPLPCPQDTAVHAARMTLKRHEADLLLA